MHTITKKMKINNTEYDSMSNSELNIILKSIENQYIMKQKQIHDIIDDLKKLDYDFIKIKSILNKRKKMFTNE